MSNLNATLDTTAAPVAAAPPAGNQRRPLGQTLIERGMLTEDQLRIALLNRRRVASDWARCWWRWAS